MIEYLNKLYGKIICRFLVDLGFAIMGEENETFYIEDHNHKAKTLKINRDNMYELNSAKAFIYFNNYTKK